MLTLVLQFSGRCVNTVVLEFSGCCVNTSTTIFRTLCYDCTSIASLTCLFVFVSGFINVGFVFCGIMDHLCSILFPILSSLPASTVFDVILIVTYRFASLRAHLFLCFAVTDRFAFLRSFVFMFWCHRPVCFSRFFCFYVLVSQTGLLLSVLLFVCSSVTTGLPFSVLLFLCSRVTDWFAFLRSFVVFHIEYLCDFWQ